VFVLDVGSVEGAELVVLVSVEPVAGPLGHRSDDEGLVGQQLASASARARYKSDRIGLDYTFNWMGSEDET